MSASPVARQVTHSQAIPRRVQITSSSQLPNEYSTTPGGTIYSTTPGGTRIVYERSVLLQLRNSPMARTPPANIQLIPGLTSSISPSKLIQDNSNKEVLKPTPVSTDKSVTPPPCEGLGTDDQFQMEL